MSDLTGNPHAAGATGLLAQVAGAYPDPLLFQHAQTEALLAVAWEIRALREMLSALPSEKQAQAELIRKQAASLSGMQR